MRSWFALLLLPALAGFAAAGPGHPGIVAVTPTSPWTLRELQRAGAAIASYDPETGIAHVVATPAEERRLVERGFAVSTLEFDLDAGLRRIQGPPDLGPYHTYLETVAELESLQARHPSICRIEVLGQSVEGRAIVALKISDLPELDEPDEPDVLVVGCHHAREFMTVEVPLHLAATLVEGYGVSPHLTQLVDTRELWIVPMLNPDGHVFQEIEQTDPDWLPPGWRKNRRPNLDGTIGVDLNRNYGFMWGCDEEGSSGDGASEDYRGSEAFSEPETRALRQLVERQRFVISLSYHSYGALLLYPWGYTRAELTEDQPLFAVLADSMVAENGYRPGNAFSGTIYVTNGEFDDYLYGELSPRKPTRTMAFTVELNSGGEGGFWPLDRFVAPTCAAMLPMNLFALDVAANVRGPFPAPPPRLAAHQDPHDGRRIHLEWTQPQDAGNPVDHYEVFEIATSGKWIPPVASRIDSSGRQVLARDVVRPTGGTIALRLSAELEPLWDYAYVEARAPGGPWRPLRGEATRDASPTGRNQGAGLTGPFHEQVLGFQLGELRAPRLDLALRLDAHPETPRRPYLCARLDLAATYREERRVLDPNVRDTHYDLVAEQPGVFGYGVTAVDVDGQPSDSEVLFFVIPPVAVQVRDVEIVLGGGRLELRWHSLGGAPAEFEAWTRRMGSEERLGDAVAEWANGGYERRAATKVEGPGAASLAWDAEAGAHAVLLRGLDRDGERVWGPWRAEARRATRLGVPAPNPFNPGASLVIEIGTERDVALDLCSVDGRIVRRLCTARLPAGEHRVQWDGRDDAGRAVGSGVYVARLRAGADLRTQRLVLLR